MSTFAPLFGRLQASALATTIGDSTVLTGVLSGVHLLGLTLLVGAVLVSSLRLMGFALADSPVAEVTAFARRASVAGLFVSLTSGLLLVMPRISDASANWIFQLKMLLLVAAATFHFAVYRPAANGVNRTRLPSPMVGVLGGVLWLSVVLAGCAFLLIE